MKNKNIRWGAPAPEVARFVFLELPGGVGEALQAAKKAAESQNVSGALAQLKQEVQQNPIPKNPQELIKAAQKAAPSILQNAPQALEEIKKVVPQSGEILNQVIAAGANVLNPQAEPTPEDQAEFNNRITALKNMLMAKPEMQAILLAKLKDADKISMFWANYDIMIHYPLGYGFDTDRMMNDVQARGNKSPAEQAIASAIFNDRAAFDEVMHAAFRLSAGTPELNAVLKNPVARHEIKKLVKANIPNIMGMKDQMAKNPLGAILMNAMAGGVAGGVESNMDNIVAILQSNPALLQMVIDQAWNHRQVLEKKAGLAVKLNYEMASDTSDDLSLPGQYNTFRAETYLGSFNSFDMFVVKVGENKYRVLGINMQMSADELVCSMNEFSSDQACYEYIRTNQPLTFHDLNDEESNYADCTTQDVKTQYTTFYNTLVSAKQRGPGLPEGS